MNTEELNRKQDLIERGKFQLRQLLSLELEVLEEEFVDRIKNQIEELKSTIVECEERLLELHTECIIDQFMVDLEVGHRQLTEINAALIGEIRAVLNYEGPGSFAEAAYSVDELISLGEGGDLLIDFENGFVISQSGMVSLFAGAITLFTME